MAGFAASSFSKYLIQWGSLHTSPCFYCCHHAGKQARVWLAVTSEPRLVVCFPQNTKSLTNLGYHSQAGMSQQTRLANNRREGGWEPFSSGSQHVHHQPEWEGTFFSPGVAAAHEESCWSYMPVAKVAWARNRNGETDRRGSYFCAICHIPAIATSGQTQGATSVQRRSKSTSRGSE